MGKYKRLGLNLIWIFIGNIGSKSISFILLPFYTHWLSPSDYGITDILNVYISLVSTIIFCNITDSIFIFPKGKNLGRQKQYFSSCLAFYAVAVIALSLLLFLTYFIAIRYETDCIFTNYIGYVWLMVTTSVFSQIIQQFVRSIDKIKIYSITGVVGTISTALFSFVLIPMYGVDGFVISMSMAAVVASIYAMLAANIFNYFSLRYIGKDCIKEMLTYSIPLIPNGIMWFLINSLNRPLMERYLGLATIGVYAVAYKLPSILKMIFQLFQQAWIISAIEEAKEKDFPLFYNRMLKLIISVQVLLAIIIILLSKYFIILLTSESFFEAYRYIPLLLISVIFDNVAAFVGVNFSISRKSKYYFYSTLYGGFAALLFNFILIPLFGIWGACLSIVLSLLCTMVARICYSWKFVKITDALYYIELAVLVGTLVLAQFFTSGILYALFIVLSLVYLLAELIS